MKTRDLLNILFPTVRVFLFGLFLFFFIINENKVWAQQDSVPETKKKEVVLEKQTENSRQNELKTVYRFELNEAIFPGAWRRVKKAVEDAEAQQADLIVMQLNTYGGAVDMADSIRTKLLKTKIPTAVFINNNAASAGALISLACDSIYMVQGAQIGAATVVDGNTGQQMPDKYQSYMRATMRSTAEMQGRDPMIAEAMVDDRIKIEGVIDSGKTLTFTTNEAIKNDYCEGVYNNVQEVVAHLAPNHKVLYYRPGKFDGFINFLLNPMVSSLLMLIMFIGIYAEVQTPGVGFPILAAMTAATLYFAPNYIEGLAQNWEILLFIGGIVLLLVEIFVIPGFGIAGIAGLILIMSGLALSLVYNDFFDFTFTNPTAIKSAFVRVFFSIIGAIVAAIIIGGRFVKTRSFGKLVLDSEQNTEEGFTVKDESYQQLIGEEGVALTDLKISGRIKIGDERYEAITMGEFLEAGTKVKVKNYRGTTLVVEEVEVEKEDVEEE